MNKDPDEKHKNEQQIQDPESVCDLQKYPDTVITECGCEVSVYDDDPNDDWFDEDDDC